MPDIPGLRYVPDYLDAATHDALLEAVSLSTWTMPAGQRRIQMHGYAYDAVHRKMRREGDLPPWASALATRLHADGLTPRVPDQLLVNEYEPGLGVSSHKDLDFFTETIISISLASTCVMEFNHPLTRRTERLLLEPSSALVMSGEVREDWEHAIPARASDEWMGRTIARGRRVSLTFRNVRDTSG